MVYGSHATFVSCIFMSRLLESYHTYFGKKDIYTTITLAFSHNTSLDLYTDDQVTIKADKLELLVFICLQSLTNAALNIFI